MFKKIANANFAFKLNSVILNLTQPELRFGS